MIDFQNGNLSLIEKDSYSILIQVINSSWEAIDNDKEVNYYA